MNKLQQIYQQLTDGKLSRQTALEQIKLLKNPSSSQDTAQGHLLGAPLWQERGLDSDLATLMKQAKLAKLAQSDETEHHIILCPLNHVDSCALTSELKPKLPQSHCQEVVWTDNNLGDRYQHTALVCFELLQQISKLQPKSKVQIQLVCSSDLEQGILAGLSGLFASASLENPHIQGQIIFVPSSITAEVLATRLLDEWAKPQDGSQDSLIKYQQDQRFIMSWQEMTTASDPAPAVEIFKERGVYLITGGLGGLGMLFAREILAQCPSARLILTGRGLLTVEKQALLDTLSSAAGDTAPLLQPLLPPLLQPLYWPLDITDAEQVQQLIDGIINQHGQLNGIIHSAGMVADNFIVKKSSAEFARVLAPKVTGSNNLDLASAAVELDFLVLFSSLSAVMGNVGQADYASANGFMDQFSRYRNGLVASGDRRGKTLSINWPYWDEGGMKVDDAHLQMFRQSTGMAAMQTATGMSGFYHSLASDQDQTLVVEGDLARLRAVLFAPVERKSVEPFEPTKSAEAIEVPERSDAVPQRSQTVAVDYANLADKTLDFLRKQLSSLLNITSHQIDAEAPLETYGIDSIMAMSLTAELEKTFGVLSKTLFFEYQTLTELNNYFIAAYPTKLVELFGAPAQAQSKAQTTGQGSSRQPSGQYKTQAKAQPKAQSKVQAKAKAQPKSTVSNAITANSPIAIIGLSGRYPQAENISAYWQNLREGKDCISEVPKERWDWQQYYTDDRSKSGHHFSKWGGFIAGVDEFDPLFFNISPREAQTMDPQERLFLQQSWMAVEDAGYSRSGLQLVGQTAGQLAGKESEQDGGQVGVYVGVMFGEYQLFGAENSLRGQRMGFAISLASIANRVSYVLNLHGPSMTVDTMCSSSLTAIHLACQDLMLARTHLAIAGGVNITVHPNKYLMLSAGQFISSDGHCQSFGEGGDGYIPGEGVGVVVLKRAEEAKRDGNHIYGIIKGSALNHGGKTNGYTVPNPQAQANAIVRALTEANIDPRHISYIEAHGTGTKLGDPIEISALSKAFGQMSATDDMPNGYCLIGSAKSNIGHCESAAGIAGLSKVLLQMQHKQIVPSLHSTRLNPHIDFAHSPFVVNQTLTPWDNPVVDGQSCPRIAGVSSFGAGGSNAHIIIEEYIEEQVELDIRQVIIVLSARTTEQLQQQVVDLLAFVELTDHAQKLDLTAMAYTLQIGREAMAQRLALIVDSTTGLIDQLTTYLADGQADDVYRGHAPTTGPDTSKGSKAGMQLISQDDDMREAIDKWISRRKYGKLVDLWVNGLVVDWHKLYGDITPKRISLPTYPFAKERYWIDTAPAGQTLTTGDNQVHPLLHRNISDLYQQCYSTTFSGDEFFLTDHQVDGHKILPGVVYLEMARVAVMDATATSTDTMGLTLRNVVWAQPLVVSQSKPVLTALFELGEDPAKLDFEIISTEDGQDIVHCQGQAQLNAQPSERLDVAQLKTQMTQGSLQPNDIYRAFSKMGLDYGAAHQGITALYQGELQLLAELELPDVVAATQGVYQLHPSLLDSALQASIGLLGNVKQLPFALSSLTIIAACSAQMLAWVRFSPGCLPTDKVVKLDIDLMDRQGNVCVQLRAFTARAATNSKTNTSKDSDLLLATPVWQPGLIPAFTLPINMSGHHIILCDMNTVDSQALEDLIPGSQCLVLHSESEQEQASVGARYQDYALRCFKLIQHILTNKPQGKPQDKVLIQFVTENSSQQRLFAGLAGLLNTAAQENPQLCGQVILTEAQTSTATLAERLRENQTSADTLINYDQGTRLIAGWQPLVIEPTAEAKATFKDHGVYLITGGLGGLGRLFAKEILSQTNNATVILTGRSALTVAKQAQLTAMSDAPAQLEYHQVDITDSSQVNQLVSTIVDSHGQLNGIIHSAGLVADNFLIKKSAAEFAQVLAPKVLGCVNLDQATHTSAAIELDFLVLFSSISGATGNPGQADYAAANGFMDQFAHYRNDLVSAKQRHGKTLTINWPLWQHGGMTISQSLQELLRQSTGMAPLQTENGLLAFYHSLSSEYGQTLVVEGDVKRIQRELLSESKSEAQPEVIQAVSDTVNNTVDDTVDGKDSAGLSEQTGDYLRQQLSTLLKLPAHQIDVESPLENYGIDSVLSMSLTNELEKTFGSLSKTLFFEYQTLDQLRHYFIQAHGQTLTALFSTTANAEQHVEQPVEQLVEKPPERATKRRFSRRTAVAAAKPSDEIAIIGLSGRYPQANDVAAYWTNLREGKDCITEVPKARWDWREYYSQDRSQTGRHFSKWGGFMAGVDEFDPLFFAISPVEAQLMDPQERLFLQQAWLAVEDAGYTRSSLQMADKLDQLDFAGQVGVYVGVMYGEYQLLGAEASLQGQRMGFAGSLASVANRVSYVLNLHGPSMTLDTMCSSSLTAIHLACQDLKVGRTALAIAGGVNVTIHPNKYLMLSAGQFISDDGHCQSFGEGGDGYIPGEGVGAVILKRAEEAKQEGNHIYGLIKGSALNHGGKTNGYTVPNPQAQASAIGRVLAESNTDSRHISYIEAHGTGTKLGDPIEISGLSKAFKDYDLGAGSAPKVYGFCAIGSAKSNIGHCESAAGMAGLTKVLLQMKHQQIVPSLHSSRLNPHIDFDHSPFEVNQSLKPWLQPVVDGQVKPRIAGVSSFGAGGANAHILIEEYQPSSVAKPLESGQVIITLSARTEEQLQQRVSDLLAFIDASLDATTDAEAEPLDLAAMAYTLQIGREAMAQRLGLIVDSVALLAEKLRAYAEFDGKGLEAEQTATTPTTTTTDIYRGTVKSNKDGMFIINQDDDMREAIDKWIKRKKHAKLVDLWVKGLEVDWHKLYGEVKPGRISLPTYPFAQERYWIEPGIETGIEPVTGTSDLAQQRQSPGLKNIGTLLAMPVWQTRELAAVDAPGPVDSQYAAHHIILCEMATVDANKLETLLPGSLCLVLQQNEQTEQATIAERFSQTALSCFDLLQQILQHFPKGKVLVQVVTSNEQQQMLFAGLSGLLKTANLENPHLIGQMILTDDPITTDSLATRLQHNRHAVSDKLINYVGDIRQVAGWQEMAADTPPMMFKEQGVYLITGGLGGLGLLFAKEILRQTTQGIIILTGRSALSDEKQAMLTALAGATAERVIYRQLDITNLTEVEDLLADLAAQYPPLNGIIHSAGMVADNFIINKTRDQFGQVLAPKVTGTLNLDLASAALPLDFMVLFSSTAGAVGNLGQADYATANGFMDQFAGYRQQLVKQQQRQGKTLSINWPLWQAGGMEIDPTSQQMLQQATGMQPLQTANGLLSFYQSLALKSSQTLVMEGDLEQIRAQLLNQPSAEVTAISKPELTQEVSQEVLHNKTLHKIKQLFGTVIKLAVDKIDAEEELSAYGIDSVMITTLNQQLTEVFGDISKTLFFEYQTLAQLTGYFCQQYWAQCVQWTGLAQQPAQSNAQAQPHSSQTNQTDMQPQKPVLSDAVASGQRAEIAIIGISGMYPGAATLDDFWHNLKTGTNGISEIPSERWSLDGFYQADVEQAVEQGKSYSKWGGFVSQFSQFDPLFFGIAPREAINIDPQERLFLQTAWQAMENAGYTRTLMRQQVKQRVGVFAGITKTGFNLYGADISLEQEKFYPHTSFSSVANRLSFFLDINGPSMPIDTMCSSSLTAIHEACEHIHRGDCDLAFAGGVNLYLHPSSYIGLCAQQMLSRDGLCKSFGAGGNGFVPGEGVGVALLKPLAAAIADNDHIHGTILATQINHGGKTNGYTVPNPKAQTALIRHTLDKAGISARDVSYIEAHGTGTALGDPIEISGLQQAFAPDSRERGYCKIGSAKSNIGHLEAAAGIAGLSKVLLQMKHRQIAPTLHAQTANPNIDFAKTAFEVNQHLTPWQPLSELGHNMPRIAGVSSFGAGGANAHILVQEYLPVSAQAKGQAAAISDDKVAGKLTVKIVVPLSARTPAQLMQRASDLLDFINQSATQPDLLSVAYTLQTGREAMDHRLVFMVDSMAQLSGQLSAYIDAEQGGENVYQGQVTGNKEALAALSAEQGTNLDPSSLASLWCQGMAVDWLKAIDPLKAADYGSKPQRIPLPGYPFAGKRYWLDSINKVKPAKPPGTQPVTQVVASVLHPLVHTNTSSLRQHSYSSTFSADQWLLADHQVNGQKVLPAVAYLEMAKAAIADAVPELHQSIMVTLHNLVWAQPIIVTDDKQVKIMLFADQRTTEWERINFEIVSTEVLNNVQQETIHCQGQALLSHQCAPIKHDLNLLQQAHQDQSHSIYPTFKRLGTDYGPSYQPITALHTTKGQALAHLDGGDNMKGFGLPPGLMQGALQTSFAVLSSELSADLKNGLSSEKTLPPSLPVAMAMASIKILSPCSSKMVAWARYNQHDGQQRTVLDVDLMDLQGNVCVQMQGISYDLPRPPQMPHPSVAEVAEVQVQKPQQAVPVDLPSSPRKISF